MKLLKKLKEKLNDWEENDDNLVLDVLLMLAVATMVIVFCLLIKAFLLL